MSRAPLEEGFPLGVRLKSARQAQGLSQRELARRANITNANLSMIEQDKVSPALVTLEKILQALSLDLSTFFSASGEPSPIHKAEDFLTIKRKGVTFRILPASTNLATQIATVILPPAASLDELWFKKGGAKGEGRVLGIVTDGELELVLAGISHRLSTGDGFDFPLRTKFTFVNRMERDGVIWVGIEV